MSALRGANFIDRAFAARLPACCTPALESRRSRATQLGLGFRVSRPLHSSFFSPALAQAGAWQQQQQRHGGSAPPAHARCQRKEGSGLRTAARRRQVEPSTATVDDDEALDEATRLRREKARRAEDAMAQINSTHGANSVMRLGDGARPIETFSTGCLTLDHALSGGWPKGRVIEIFGHESSGKTTLALHAMVEVQKRGGIVMVVDAEHAFDAMYAQSLGLDIHGLYVAQPECGEVALDMVSTMCRSGGADLVLIDSVSALVPRAEIEGEMGSVTIGGQARLMSQSMRRLVHEASLHKCTLIFINQIRMKIGQVYGNPETTSGGMALRFFASLRIELRPFGPKLKVGDEEVGMRVKAIVKKSKVSTPYKVAELEIIFGAGISRLASAVDTGEVVGIVERKGAWYSFGEHRLGQGREKAVQFLKDNPLIADQLEADIRKRIRDGPAAAIDDGFGFDDDDDNVSENGAERADFEG